MMCHCTVEVKASKIMDCTGTDSDILNQRQNLEKKEGQDRNITFCLVFRFCTGCGTM